MKRKALVISVLAAAVTLALGQPLAAQCPSASCPSQTLGAIELPVDGSTVSGYVLISGFALDGNQLSSIDVYVDGTDPSNLVTGVGGIKLQIARPDVMQQFPAYLGTAGNLPGFVASFRASNYPNGVHTVYVRVTDTSGCCYFLAPRTITINNAINQPPFGALDYPLPNGSVNANGVLEVYGWTLDDTRVNHVDVYLDGLVERQAVTGVVRADVAAAFPDSIDAVTSGFILNVDSTRLPNGVHEVTVKAVDDQGQTGLIGTRQFQVFSNAPSLPPFGEVEYPLLNATWFGNCFRPVSGSPSGGGGDIVDPRYLMRVTGWALDTSIAEERGGVSNVRLELDGVVIKDTRINCHREFLLNNALIDCYGYYRPDIEVLYPGFQQAPNSGFQFFVDVGYLLTQKGIVEGAHMLQLKAYDKEDNWTLVKEVPVVLECATQNLDPPPIAFVEDPTNYELIGGVWPVTGWALDLDNVVKVRVLVDGIPQIDAISGYDYAEYGFASPDIAALYPNYPQNNAARFRFFLDTTKISNSEHDLNVEVQDGRGARRTAGTRRFLVSNRTLVR
jgi:hypothetical protein